MRRCSPLLSLLLAAGCGGPPAPSVLDELQGDEAGPYDVLPSAHDEDPEAFAASRSALQAGETECIYRADGKTKTVAVTGKRRVRFALRDLPDPGRVRRAELEYRAFDADLPRADGWLKVGESRRVAMPARPRFGERWRRFRIDVTGRVGAGQQRITFSARDRTVAGFRIKQVRLRLVGAGLVCAAPPAAPPAPTPPPSPPGDLVRNRTPAGVAAFAALEPTFPRRGLMRILGGLERPYTSVLLDFGPAYDRHGRQMFRGGPVGARRPNPAHFDALDDFIRAYVAATPHAQTRKLQLYVVNGPGMRRGGGYAQAYPMGLAAFDRAVQGDRAVRAELRGYLQALVARLAPFQEQVDFRLVPELEDNLSVAGFRAMRRLARDAGFTGKIGRNPCACGGYGDLERAGDFLEDHVHGAGSVARLPGRLRAGDVVSNDGWGWTVPHAGRVVTDRDVVALARKARAHRVWLNLWYDPIQGYPVPSRGPRNYRFDDRPEHLLELLRRGL